MYVKLSIHSEQQAGHLFECPYLRSVPLDSLQACNADVLPGYQNRTTWMHAMTFNDNNTEEQEEQETPDFSQQDHN
jgi:hypothetical protein